MTKIVNRNILIFIIDEMYFMTVKTKKTSHILRIYNHVFGFIFPKCIIYNINIYTDTFIFLVIAFKCATKSI